MDRFEKIFELLKKYDNNETITVGDLEDCYESLDDLNKVVDTTISNIIREKRVER